MANLALAPQWFKDSFAGYTSWFNNISYGTDSDLRTMITEYRQDLDSGKKVVIVAHSQGNFYANAAYEHIRTHYSKYKDSIGIVAVGTPSGRVQDDGPHTINSLNFITNLLRALKFYVLPWNMTYDEPNSFLNHGFVSTYLAAARGKIRADIFNTIARLKTPKKDIECSTPEEVPVTVATKPATNIDETTAQVNGYVGSGKNIDAWHIFDTGIPGPCSATAGSRDGTGPYNTGNNIVSNRTGLTPGTTYYYRMCGKGTGNRVSDGGYISFKTASAPTKVDTRAPTNNNGTTATLNGYVTSGKNIDAWFVWNTGIRIPDPCSATAGSRDGKGPYNTGDDFRTAISGFTPGTTIYYRACGKGSDKSVSDSGYDWFRTVQLPTDVVTLPVANVRDTSVLLRGYVRSGTSIDYWWIKGGNYSNITCYGSYGDNKDGVGSGDTGETKTYTSSGLRPGTKYYYRFCGKGKDGISQGAYKSFTTASPPKSWRSWMSPHDPLPEQDVMVYVDVNVPGVDVAYSVRGTDGYTASGTITSGSTGIISFYIPGTESGVRDTVTVSVPSWGPKFTRTWTYVF